MIQQANNSGHIILNYYSYVIHARIRKRRVFVFDITEISFKHGFGTRKTLFSFTVLLQKCRDQFARFVVNEKAFDRVQRVKLIEALQKSEIDQRNLQIIKNLYWYQTAIIRVPVS